MSSRALRFRNIDVGKSLRIVRTAGDTPAVAASATGDEEPYSPYDQGQQRRQGRPNTHNKKRKKLKEPIPIPNVRIVRHRPLDRNKRLWEQPGHYIKYHLSTGAQIPHANDFYDFLKVDQDWLEKTANRDGITVPREVFAKLIEVWEKEVGRLAIRANIKRKPRSEIYRSTNFAPVDIKQIFPIKDAEFVAGQNQIHDKFIPMVYEYWNKRRTSNMKALMRRYQEPPAHDDSSPGRAFRPRERERRTSHRNPRKNDPTSYNKLRYLKRDFETVLHILRLVRDREIMKRDQFLLDAQIFDEKLRLTPFGQLFSNMTITEKSAESDKNFCKLMRSRLVPSSYALEQDARSGAWRHRRPTRPTALTINRMALDSRTDRNRETDLSSDDSESECSDTPSDIEFYRQVEESLKTSDSCSSLPDWEPMDEEDPFRYTDSPIVYRGFSGKARPRVGRLGRVMFDLAMVEVPGDGSDADDEREDDTHHNFQNGTREKEPKDTEKDKLDLFSSENVPDLPMDPSIDSLSSSLDQAQPDPLDLDHSDRQQLNPASFMNGTDVNMMLVDS